MTMNFKNNYNNDLTVAMAGTRVFFASTATILTISLTILLYSGSDAPGDAGGLITHLQRSAGAIVLLIAAASVGGILGFLFGIPRSISEAASAVKEGTTAPRQTVNTNLEQISDWLTKTIVGVGLVEFKDLGSGILAISTKIAPLFGSASTPTSRDIAVSAVILIGSTALGFLFSYVETRTLLSWIFATSAKRESDLNEIFAANLINQKTAEDGDSGRKDPTAKAAIATILNRSFDDLPTIDEKRAWANAQFLKGNYDEGTKAFGKLVKLAPDDYTIRRDFGRWLIMSGTWFKGKSELEKALRMAQQVDAEDITRYKLDIPWSYLYHPTEYEKALELCKDLVKENPELTDDPRLNTYIAAAAGQAAATAKAANDEDSWNRHKAEALDAVRRIRSSPHGGRWMALVRGMFNAHPEDADNDLVAFQDDKEFKELING